MIETKSLELLDDLINSAENLYLISWNEDGDYFCTKSFEELTGYTLNELSDLADKHYSLITDESKKDIRFPIIENFIGSINENKELVYQIESKNEENIWLKEIPLKLENNNKQLTNIVLNITETKMQEKELREEISVKKELNNSKDKLISIISHDLRAPFTSLLGFSEILLNEPNLSIEDRTEYLQYIYDASKLQLSMVNHLLDWTHLQNGTMKFEPQRLEIKDVIDNCVSVLTGTAIRKDIEIKVQAKKGLFVTADERLISQVVTNLLSNAVKFTPSGKKIFVNVGQFKENLIEVVVKDEGQGILEKNKSKLFKIESKFSETGTAGEKGSGLGLTLVKEIVEKHSGNIWFYSEKDKGSEFHFTLPKSEDTILIVEEYEDIQDLYKNIFDSKFDGYNIEFVKNGFEALNSILVKTPSFLITYHTMPLMNGIQLVSSLRKKDAHNKVSIVILADNISSEDKKKYAKFGVNNFTDVNTSPEDLCELLVQLSK